MQDARRIATYDDLLAVPAPLVAEILYGKLVAQPRPSPRHAIASNALTALITAPYQFGVLGPGGWVFMEEPELHLGDHVIVPDLAGWRRVRLPALPDTAWVETVPDWLCETLSPSTEHYDRGEKRVIYAEAGVRHLWYVDPRSRTLEIFELIDGQRVVAGEFSNSGAVSAPPFVGIAFELSWLWPYDTQPMPEPDKS